MKYIKFLLCSFLVLAIFSITSMVQAATVGTTTQPASQVIAYYNTAEGDSDLQITNTSFLSPVVIHVQILDQLCNELNFFVELTEGDTHQIDIGDETGFSQTNGIIIVNAVAAVNDFDPIVYPHLIGSITIEEGEEAYYANAMGRQLIGGVFETIVPVDVYSPFWDDYLLDSDVILAAWTDSYAGGYLASAGTATTQPGDDPVGLFIVDDMENRDSCGELALECLFVGAPNNDFDSDLFVGDEADYAPVCAFNSDVRGFVEFNNLAISENLLAMSAADDDNEGFEGFDYSIYIGAQDIAPPPVEDCDSGADEDADGLIDCADPDCAADVACAEGGAGSCNNDTDDDADGATDCADEDCDGVAGCEFGEELSCADGLDNDADTNIDCADSDCDGDPACDQGGSGGGGGGSCSIASAGSISLANALILLIPAIGIAIRRRLIG